MTPARLGAIVLLAAANAAADEPPDPRRLEVGLLPALAYDSDTGLGFGAIGTLARFDPAFTPYRFRLLAQLYLSAKEAPGGGLELPYHDHYLLLDLPGERARLSLRLAFGRFRTAGYYGLGQGAEIDEARLAASPRAYAYDRTYPEIEPGARVPIARRLDLVLRTRLVYSVIQPYPDSQLADDLARGLLAGIDRHLLAAVSAGLLWDRRDHESAPSRGMLHEATLRAGVGLGSRFAYGGARLDARFFAPLVADHLVAAVRGVLDALVGRPPVYELALGGATTVRGLRGQRFHGKVRAIGNLELRSRLARFALARQRFILGALVFLDAGRVLAELDEGGVAFGAGGGLRLQWGQHFLVRVDVARSPTDGTTGLYIDVGHIF